MKFRYLTAEDATEMARMIRYAFGTNKNNFENLETKWETKRAPRTLGLFDEDKMKACAVNLDYKLFFRGIWLKTAAIAGVACRPEYRRQGLMKQVLKHLFRDISEGGQPISALYPSNYPFYEKFGYRVVADMEIITVPTYEIKIKPVKGITAKLVDDSEFLEVAPQVYNKVIERYSFVFHRTEDMWKDIVKYYKGFKFVFYRDDGSPTAYGILKFDKYDWDNDPDEKSIVRLTDFYWDSPEAKQAVFNLLRNHDSQRKYAIFHTFDRHSLAYIRDIATVKRETKPGIMFRIINVRSTLEQIQYPSGIQGSFKFALTDECCPWNNQIFEVEIDSGKSTVEVIKDNQSLNNDHFQLDFKCDIGPLSQLIAGYLNYDKLVGSGEIIRYSDNHTPLEAFPEQVNVPRDYF
ncbi:MAG: enhanced intracellular survival protein Eis [Promethearchaeota archaeon]